MYKIHRCTRGAIDAKVIITLVVAGLAAVLFWPAGGSQKVKNLYEEAEAMYSAQNYEEAINKYNEALLEAEKRFINTDVIDKDFPTLAKYKIAVCYSNLAEQRGDVAYYDKALEYIEEIYPVARVRKHQEGITYLWGHVQFKQEKFEESEPKFVELIGRFPDSIFVENAWYAIGQINYKLEKFEEARKAFKSVIDNFPHSEYKDDAQQLIAQSFFIEENFKQALTAFDVLTTEGFKNYPDLQPEAKYKAAHCLFQLGRDDEAIARYNSYIAEHPDDRLVLAAYFDLGAIYAKQKDYDNARTNYELALQHTDDVQTQADIQREIERVYSDQKGQALANGVIEKKRKDEKFDAQAAEIQMKLKLGDTQLKMENYENAVAEYKKVWDEYMDLPKYFPLKIAAKFQEGYAYYKASRPPGYDDEAPDKNAVFNEELLRKSVEAYKMVIDKFSNDNFDLDKYGDFTNRAETVENSRLNLALAYEKL